MKTEIQIVDRGRGPQLSTSRVTVQDLVPYFQDGSSHDEIIRWIPTLSAEEIAVVERYYSEHKEALDAEDRLIRQRSAQRHNPAWVEKVLEEAHAKRLAIMDRLREQEANGEAK
jgi:uncharacterized protein (DUF433 family)